MPQHSQQLEVGDDTTGQLQQAAYILVVDDEPDIRNLLQEILEDEGYEVAVAEDGEHARHMARKRKPDLVLLDIWMPDVDGITLLKEWAEEGAGLPMPVIMMSGHGTVETAVEATRVGAYDYIEKPLSLAKLLLTIRHALEAEQLQRENQGLRKLTHTANEPLGKSAVMQRLREQVKRVAEHDTWVLMCGESGSGINAVAHYLHNCSVHRERPFVEVNVASLAPDTAAEELFGAEREKLHYGLLEQATGGTLYLSDIADMDLTTQAKLHSALEAKSFTRVGGSEPVRLNARIIAATHHNLEQLIEAGRFRKDLYYQLNVVPIQVPPLREHREDVPELLNYFVNLYVDQQNLPYRKFTTAAQNRLRNYHWPGNVRELSNLVQRLLIIGAGSEISLEEVESALGGEGAAAPVAEVPMGYDRPLREAREQFERAYLEYQLKQLGGNVGKVAKIVGLERTHLYRKLRALGIDPKSLSDED